MKKTVIIFMAVIIGAGAVYSFQQVKFAQKTSAFFQVVLSDETGAGSGARAPRSHSLREAPVLDGQGPQSNSDGHAGGGWQGAAGTSVISLMKVWKYLLIFAFCTMITRKLDTGLRSLRGRVGNKNSARPSRRQHRLVNA